MPPRKSQLAQIDKRQLELSNLSKILYPEDAFTKAQVLDYYLKIAPAMLAHAKGRPLSALRFPEGVHGESFFQKNRPQWAPEWLEHVVLGQEKKDYVLATEPASLIWLANLACLELHQMHSRSPRFEKPDYIVYDLDPPEGCLFKNVSKIALEFRQHLESFGYHPFVKTTGRKGLHIVTPIEPKWDFETAFQAAKTVAQPFVESHGSVLTLQIKKEHRHGKILLDIYRNRQSQTIIAAYSLRGTPGAPVSMPIHWEELPSIEDPKVFTLQNVPELIAANGDAWETVSGYATPIHTESRATAASPKPLPTARTYKTADQLVRYSNKRNFSKTPEPQPVAHAHPGSAFVVHRHHASRLHYDLRLEHGGVLRSWAVPKGLPPRPGIRRLAVNVEDHPLDYVNFEGIIPKGEYGGGTMWKFAQGWHEITKEKKDGFYFRLHSRELEAEYRIHRTKENQWLLERVDSPQSDWLRSPVEPMLAQISKTSPDSPDYLYEVKWDGIRALFYLDEGQIRIYGRSGIELTRQFPELASAGELFRASSAIFDGEIVCLDPQGKPIFTNVISRIQQTSSGAIERARSKNPAVCYLFDCLYLDGRSIMQDPLTRRREWLQDCIRSGTNFRLSEAFEDGKGLFEAVRTMNLEGIIAKQKLSPYVTGRRSDTWLKIKSRQTTECIVIGYTRGKGGRETEFGALHLAQPTAGGLRYVGKVGTGFDDETMREVRRALESLTTSIRPVKEKPLDSARSVWVEPKLLCEVRYASITQDGMLREPVFVRLRPDLVGPK